MWEVFDCRDGAVLSTHDTEQECLDKIAKYRTMSEYMEVTPNPWFWDYDEVKDASAPEEL